MSNQSYLTQDEVDFLALLADDLNSPTCEETAFFLGDDLSSLESLAKKGILEYQKESDSEFSCYRLKLLKSYKVTIDFILQ